VSEPQLSVVIPAYNEEHRLPTTLERLLRHLRPRGEDFEILVVDDGSSDATGAVTADLRDARVSVVRNSVNRGKGHSVRRGMLRARGARRLMTDADLSTPIEDLPTLAASLDAGYDVAIGSRALRASNVLVHQSFLREAVGRAFNLGVRTLLLPDLHDTQCGFKLWSAAAATAAFSRTRLDGFCFDVEALLIARRHGYRIAEVPVTWRNDAATRVGFGKGARAFSDLLRIRLQAGRGLYEGPPLESD
jgi:dolichyl-phosphate beta-glucosyltransferase